MENYDNSELGVEHPNHPANEIEVIELTQDEQRIQDLEIQIKEIQKIYSNILRMESEEGIFSQCIGMDEEKESKYIKAKEIFNFKLNQL